jgi:hypothetical protein
VKVSLVAVTRGLKIWVFICLCSLLIWLICLRVWGFFGSFLNVMLGLPDLYVGNIGMFLADGAGLGARCLGAVMALSVAFVIWGGGRLDRSVPRVERLVEAVLFLEGTYFVLLFPSGLWRISSGLNFLGVAYLLQAASAGAGLLFLSFKVRGSAGNVGVLKYVGVAAVGYVGALWCNVVFKWFDMIGVLGSSFLLRGSAAWGFLGSLITMTLAVVFAVFGAYYLAKNKGEAVWWFGFSLMLIGIHYVIYTTYYWQSSNLDSALPMDVWTLPFIGLGLTLLRMKGSKTVI